MTDDTNSAPDAPESVIYCPRFVRLMAVLLWIMCVFWLGQLVVVGDWSGLVAQAPVAAWIALTVYLLFWVPGVRIDHDALTLENVTRSIRIPYGDLAKLDTRLAFTAFDTADKKYVAWASPTSPSMMNLQRLSRLQDSKQKQVFASHPQDKNSLVLPGADGTDAALEVGQQWARWQKSRKVDTPVSVSKTNIEIGWRGLALGTWALLTLYIVASTWWLHVG